MLSPVTGKPFYRKPYLYAISEEGQLHHFNMQGNAEHITKFEKGAMCDLVFDHDNTRLYIGSLDYNLYAYDIQFGKEVWRFRAGAPIRETPVYDKGILYFKARGYYFYVLKPVITEEKDTYELLWKLEEPTRFLFKGRVLTYCYSDKTKTLFAITDRGTVKWTRSLAECKYVLANPKRERIFLFTEKGEILGLREGKMVVE